MSMNSIFVIELIFNFMFSILAAFHFQCKRSIFLLQTTIKDVYRHPFLRVYNNI